MSITDREMTATTHAEFLPTVWAKQTRNAIEHSEVLSKLVNTSYEPELSIGRTLSIPLRANYNTQTKTEGVSNTISFQSVPGSSSNNQDITVSTFEYASALLNAVVAAQSNYDERERISHGLGYALMRGVEVSIANLFQSFSQIVGSLGADPDLATLQRAWQYLADSSVEEGAAWIFGPAAVAALFGNNKLTSKDYVDGQSVIQTAELPMILNYPAYRSNLLRIPAAGQTDCTLMHKEAVILLRQIQPTFVEQFLVRNLADGIVAYNLYNASEANWVQETPAGNSDPTTGDFGAVLIRTS